MNKAAALAEARRQLAYGYFVVDGLTVSARCPRCRQEVRGHHLAWDSTTKRVARLRDALVVHLTEEHSS